MKEHNEWNGMTEGDMLVDLNNWCKGLGLDNGWLNLLSDEAIRHLWTTVNETMDLQTPARDDAPFIGGIYEFDSKGLPMVGVYTTVGLCALSLNICKNDAPNVYRKAMNGEYLNFSTKPPFSTWVLRGRVTPDGYVPEVEAWKLMAEPEDEVKLVDAVDTIDVREYVGDPALRLEMVETPYGWAPLIADTARRSPKEVYDLAKAGKYMTAEWKNPGHLKFRITNSGEVIDEV